MFERYTEKARRVIFFARYEASQFGAPAIEPEHLLLGLVREGEGIAARILESVGVTLDDARRELYAMQESDAELASFTQTLKERLKRLIPALDEPSAMSLSPLPLERKASPFSGTSS